MVIRRLINILQSLERMAQYYEELISSRVDILEDFDERSAFDLFMATNSHSHRVHIMSPDKGMYIYIRTYITYIHIYTSMNARLGWAYCFVVL